MSKMESMETKERFGEGLKQAMSRARELSKKMKNPMWDSIAISLEGIKMNGMQLANAKSKSRSEILTDIGNYQKRMNKETLN